MRKRNILSIVFICLTFWAMGLGFRMMKSLYEQKKTIHLAAYTDLGSLDPHKALDTDSINVLLNTQEGLYRLKENGSYILGLAKEEPIVSKDQCRYTFKLKKVKWSDGKPLKAEDFVFAWRRLVDPRTKSPHAYLLDNILKNAKEIRLGNKPSQSLGVSVNAKGELVIELEHPVHYLKALLDQPALYPLRKDAIKKAGGSFGDDAKFIPSIGPYQVKNWKKYQASWLYEKNKEYYDAKHVNQDRVQVKVYPSLTSAFKEFKRGKLDLLPEVGDRLMDLAPSYDLTIAPEQSVYYLQLNLNNPLLKEMDVRKSLALAINKKALVDQILQDGSKSVDYLIPHSLGGKDQSAEDYRSVFKIEGEYDPDRSRRLFQRHYYFGEKKLRLLMERSSSSQSVGEYLKTQIEDILPGLKVEPVYLDRHKLISSLEKGDFDIAFAGWNADFDDPLSFLQVFLSSSSYNYGQYFDKAYDQFVEKSRSSLLSVRKRWEYYYQAEARLIDGAVIIPLYQPYNSFVRSARLKHLAINPLGPLYDLRTIQVNKK